MATNFEPGNLADNPWKMVGTLGGGAYGLVCLYKHQVTGEQIAVKNFRNSGDLTSERERNWRRECDLSLSLVHPNLIQGLQVPHQLTSIAGKLPLLAMEFCPLGDLRKVLRRPENSAGLSEYDIRCIVHDVSSAVEYLHQQNIVHRDIKPENIILSQTSERISYKLIDLGLAKDLSTGSICMSTVGTEYYMAPELLTGEKYTRKVDYWSLGVVVFECITGFGPFMNRTHPMFIQRDLCKKRPDEIYGYFDDRKTAIFSSNLPKPNQLCRLRLV